MLAVWVAGGVLTLLGALSSTIKNTNNVVQGTVESPPIKVMITRLTLDSALGWPASNAAAIQPSAAGARRRLCASSATPMACTT